MHTVPLIPVLDGLVTRFAGRTGGVSAPPFASLNLGFSTGDDPDHVIENRRRLGEAVGAPLERWVVGGQVHGTRVTHATATLAGEGACAPSDALPASDGMFLAEPGIFALGLSADCPLVVIADPLHRTSGVAHAGWRGTAAGVIEALLGEFTRCGSRPEELHAAISPGICGSCYPVGPEVFEALTGKPGIRAAKSGANLDLRRVHAVILAELGIPPERISLHPDCSSCTPELYFSHRRGGPRTGRNGVVVGWL